MSDLASVASINVNITGDGDPARGGSDTTMQSVLDTLKHIQVSVGAINGNVRAILETLKKMGTRQVTSATNAAARTVSSRVTVERVVSVDPRKAIVPYSTPFGRPMGGEEPFSPSKVEAERRRTINRLSRVPMLPEIPIGAGMTVYDPRMAQQGGLAVDDPMWRLFRQRAGAGIPRASRPRAVPAGVIGPGGAGAGGGGRSGAVPLLPGGSVPPPPPPPTAPTPSGAGAGGGINAMNLLTMVGRVLSVIQLISGFIRRIAEMIKRVIDASRALRANFATVDAPTAMMQAQIQIAQLRDNIILARASRGASAAFTREELLNIETTRMARFFGGAATSVVGAGLLRAGSNLGMIFEGIVGADSKAFSAGMVGMMGYTPIGAFLKSMFPQIDAAYNAYINGRINQARATVNGVFIDDLSEMTAGRFDPDRAYPSMRGGNRRPLATANNWWEFRP